MDVLATGMDALATGMGALATGTGGVKADVARLHAKVDAWGERLVTLEASVAGRFSQLEAHLADLHAYAVFADTTVREEAQAGFRAVGERFDRLESKLERFIDTQGGINLNVEVRLRALERPAL